MPLARSVAPTGVLPALFVVLLSAVSLAATPPPPPATQPAPEPASTPPTSQAVNPSPPESPTQPQPRGPTYNLLRWTDDFSYLEGPPDSYVKDVFDPIKWIPIGDKLRLSFGGEFRVRIESRTNMYLNQRDPTQDTLLLHRYFLHADIHYDNWARVFLQGINAMIEDRDGPPSPVEENRFDFQQAFVDLRILGPDVPLTLRIGRQELFYGVQRFVSPLDWSNDRRRFDGVKLFYEGEAWNVDAFWTRPLPIDLEDGLDHKPDQWDETSDFFGLYVTYKKIPYHVLDLYYFGLNNRGDLLNANGRIGDRTLHMIGSRLHGEIGPWYYDTELAGQFGTFAGDNIQAWAWAIDAGYTFLDVPWKPRLGAGFDFASGDRNPDDGQHQRFDHLYPLGHSWLGYIDITARENIVHGELSFSVKPRDNLAVRLAYHDFWLAQERDGLFNVGGALSRRDPDGGSGKHVGREVDLTIDWRVDRHQTVLLGWSHLWDGTFLNETGDAGQQDFIYAQYKVQF